MNYIIEVDRHSQDMNGLLIKVVTGTGFENWRSAAKADLSEQCISQRL
jgi:hypothetical protein